MKKYFYLLNKYLRSKHLQSKYLLLFSSQQGMGILESLIITGVVSTLVVGAVTTISNSMTATQTVQTVHNSYALQLAINNTLSDYHSCRENLKPVSGGISNQGIGTIDQLIHKNKTLMEKDKIFKENIEIVKMELTAADPVTPGDPTLGNVERLFTVYYKIKGVGTEINTVDHQECSDSDTSGCYFNQCVLNYRLDDFNDIHPNPGNWWYPVTQCSLWNCIGPKISLDLQNKSIDTREKTPALLDHACYTVEADHQKYTDDPSDPNDPSKKLGFLKTIIGCGSTQTLANVHGDDMVAFTHDIGSDVPDNYSADPVPRTPYPIYGLRHIFFGAGAGLVREMAGSGSTFFGNKAGIEAHIGTQDSRGGPPPPPARKRNNGDAFGNVFFGSRAGEGVYLTGFRAGVNHFLGDQAGYNDSGYTKIINGIGNTFLGAKSGNNVTIESTGVRVDLIDNYYCAKRGWTSTDPNCVNYVTNPSLLSNVEFPTVQAIPWDGTSNNFFGYESAKNATVRGISNTFLGAAGEDTVIQSEKDNNTFIGYGAGYQATIADETTTNIGNLIHIKPKQTPNIAPNPYTLTNNEVRIVGILQDCDEDGTNCKPIAHQQHYKPEVHSQYTDPPLHVTIDIGTPGVQKGIDLFNICRYARNTDDLDNPGSPFGSLNSSIYSPNAHDCTKVAYQTNDVTDPDNHHQKLRGTIHNDYNFGVSAPQTGHLEICNSSGHNCKRVTLNTHNHHNSGIDNQYALHNHTHSHNPYHNETYSPSYHHVCLPPPPCPPCPPCPPPPPPPPPSSRTLKKNIVSFTDYNLALKDINQTPLFTYEFQDTHPDKQRIGIISEELPEHLQIKVTDNTQEKISTPDWSSVYGTFWAAIKALFAKLTNMEGLKEEISVHVQAIKQTKEQLMNIQSKVTQLKDNLKSMEETMAELKSHFTSKQKELAETKKKLQTLKEQNTNL